MENKPPIVVERFADNGEHSHWEVVSSETHDVLWSEEFDWVELRDRWRLLCRKNLTIINRQGEEEIFDWFIKNVKNGRGGRNYMLTFIGISFTLKEQDFARIAPVLVGIIKEIEELGDKPVLVHGFMPKHVVIEKGFNTTVVNTLDELFPLQINCYRAGQPLRKEMAAVVNEMGGEVFVIGNVVEGVQAEVKEYEALGVPIKYIPLPETVI